MSKWPSLCCQVHRSTSCRTSREWDAKYLWGVWNSSQVLILTFEFSSVVSRWPHHLLPLSCFSLSLFLHSSQRLLSLAPLSVLFSSLLSLPHFSTPRMSSASISTVSLSLSPSLHIFFSTPWPLPGLPPLSLRCSQLSDSPISAPMIAVVGVLVWQLSRRWQEPSSAWEPLDRQPQSERQTEEEIKRGRR